MQAGVPYSNGAAPLQVPTPGAAVRQTPFAMTDTSYSQPGTSDVSAGTHVSDGSWQPRPSVQGMTLLLCKASPPPPSSPPRRGNTPIFHLQNYCRRTHETLQTLLQKSFDKSVQSVTRVERRSMSVDIVLEVVKRDTAFLLVLCH